MRKKLCKISMKRDLANLSFNRRFCDIVGVDNVDDDVLWVDLELEHKLLQLPRVVLAQLQQIVCWFHSKMIYLRLTGRQISYSIML